jgi:hypothetical protein
MDIDLDLDSTSSRHSMNISVGVSDVNLHRIKRLCIRDDAGNESDSCSNRIHVEGYASELPSSFASDCTSADSANCFQTQVSVPEQIFDRSAPLELTQYRRRKLKRPHSSLSVDATAGSSNTFFSSIYSDEIGECLNSPTFERLNARRTDAMEHISQNELCNHGINEENVYQAQNPGQEKDEMEQASKNELHNCSLHERKVAQVQFAGEGNREERIRHDYESFNTILGRLHLEREKRAKEMMIRRQENSISVLNTNSGSISSLTSFSTTTTQHGSRWSIPKQVNLPSHSNLG